MDISNGVTVHEAWETLGDTMLIAHVQYDGDARAIVDARLARDGASYERWYIITNLYDGKQTIHRRPAATLAAGDAP